MRFLTPERKALLSLVVLGLGLGATGFIVEGVFAWVLRGVGLTFLAVAAMRVLGMDVHTKR